MKKPVVLFVCTGNAGRSQMAEAMFQSRYGDLAETRSAGVDPWPALHPMAVKLMIEQGLDMSGRYPKHVKHFADFPLDIVVTIGDRAKAEAGPFRAPALHLHWEIKDPAEADGTPDSEPVFRQTCQAIADRFPELVRIITALVNQGGIMQPAICTSFDYAIPFAQCLAMIREAGFEVVSIGARPQHAGYATPEGRETIRNLLKQHGLTAESVHAPFPEGDRLFSLDETERLESIRQCQVAMDAAAELEARIVVTHLIQPYDIPHGELRNRMIDQGRRSVGVLADYAAARQVKLAFENGQKADYDQVVADFLAEFTAAHVGFCYDSGHEHVQGKCFDFLERFGHRLFTLHLHDNSGWDSHVLPYEGTIPWDRLCPILRRLAYTGNLLLEVDIKNSQFKDPAVFLAEAWKRAARF